MSIRLFQALAKQGLNVSRNNGAYQVSPLNTDGSHPPVEVLLPEDFRLESKAVKQLMALAQAHHPEGGRVLQACAMPDFHPGDEVPIGSVVATEGFVIPSAVGGDINCGMRLHALDLTLDKFESGRKELVSLLKGDYFLGTRDVVQDVKTQVAMFRDGLPGWYFSARENPLGRIQKARWDQIESEIDRVHLGGSLRGDQRWAPESLVSKDGPVRDSSLASIGSGNHFVEILRVDTVDNTSAAYAWGVRKQHHLAFMIHSGSRHVGKHVGMRWADRVRELWPKGQPHPEMFSTTHVEEYLEAEATAANYGFVNRLLLAEILRLRLREVFGERVEAPLIYDVPHNITLREEGRFVTRKGSCPAHAGQPVIIPGSMGAPSYLCMGQGQARFLCSASHGAGRAHTRFEMRHWKKDLGLTGVDCVTLREERRIEEAPVAYKAIQPVIEAQVEAGVLSPVVKFQPVMTFKA